jgi:hypothetical protein
MRDSTKASSGLAGSKSQSLPVPTPYILEMAVSPSIGGPGICQNSDFSDDPELEG